MKHRSFFAVRSDPLMLTDDGRPCLMDHADLVLRKNGLFDGYCHPAKAQFSSIPLLSKSSVQEFFAVKSVTQSKFEGAFSTPIGEFVVGASDIFYVRKLNFSEWESLDWVDLSRSTFEKRKKAGGSVTAEQIPIEDKRAYHDVSSSFMIRIKERIVPKLLRTYEDPKDVAIFQICGETFISSEYFELPSLGFLPLEHQCEVTSA